MVYQIVFVDWVNTIWLIQDLLSKLEKLIREQDTHQTASLPNNSIANT